MIRGIYTPNLVPFDDDGRINEGELRRMVNWLIEKGVSGLYPNGSTGEFIRLSFEERKRVIKIVADETRGRVPILAGAAEPNVIEILEMCRLCASLGCTAVSITGPYYFKVSQESIEHYFRDIAARSPIDILSGHARPGCRAAGKIGLLHQFVNLPDLFIGLSHHKRARDVAVVAGDGDAEVEQQRVA